MNFQEEVNNFVNNLLNKIDDDERDEMLMSDNLKEKLKSEVQNELEDDERFEGFLLSREDLLSNLLNRIEKEWEVNL